jgi:hypothetical protein
MYSSFVCIQYQEGVLSDALRDAGCVVRVGQGVLSGASELQYHNISTYLCAWYKRKKTIPPYVRTWCLTSDILTFLVQGGKKMIPPYIELGV